MYSLPESQAQYGLFIYLLVHLRLLGSLLLDVFLSLLWPCNSSQLFRVCSFTEGSIVPPVIIKFTLFFKLHDSLCWVFYVSCFTYFSVTAQASLSLPSGFCLLHTTEPGLQNIFTCSCLPNLPEIFSIPLILFPLLHVKILLSSAQPLEDSRLAVVHHLGISSTVWPIHCCAVAG